MHVKPYNEIKVKKRYPILAVAMFSALQAHAQDQSKDIQKDEHDIEVLVIRASVLNRTVLESSTPVTIISGEQLDQNQAATLGETLRNVPGVHGSYFGPVASTPIIRGLDGPRIKVVQNGLDASDASRVGPDHQVAAETSTATQIEVLRGPATLLYGSGAIGGVVNVVDNRLPLKQQEGTSAEVFAQFNSVADATLASTDINGGSGNLAWHFDAYTRDTNDFKIPVPASIEEQGGSATLLNSALRASGYTFGGGWIDDKMRLALSYGYIDSKYGIVGEEGILIKLEQGRYQGVLEWTDLSGFFKSVHWQNGYTDYQHSEFEGEEVGTTFKNETIESRLWAEHKLINGWKGVAGIHLNYLDFSAIGDEAFTPPTKTNSAAVFLMEERKVGQLLWQLGARAEQTSHTVDNDFFQVDTEQPPIFFTKTDYTAVSGSAGVVWSFDEDQSLAFNFAYSERAPSASEIFSYGPHIGSGAFEIGGAFNIVELNGAYTVGQGSQLLNKEVSNNIDISYRYIGQNWNANISVFNNYVDDYVFEQFTDLVFSGDAIITQVAFDEDVEQNGEPEEETDGLPVIAFSQQDARLYGFEAQLDLHLGDDWRWEVFTDYTRAKLNNGGNVPRIPPLRVGSSVHYEYQDWHAEIELIRYNEQAQIAENETKTDTYTMISASVNYYLDLDNVDMTFYLKGENLNNQEGRVHSSYLKDEAPLPARSFSVGVRARF